MVTINILSFNRKVELKNTLNKIYEQDYEDIEVIVVDNASTDGSPEMIKNDFPEVQLIQLDKNIGIAGWNEGFKIAKGEYILVLDDDSYPEKDTIVLAVQCINNNPKIGVLCLPVFNKLFNIYETDHINKNFPLTFIGCGALISKHLIDEIGLFNEILFLYEHEIEFSMRVYEAGYEISYCKEALIVHENTVKNRKISNKIDHRRKFYVSRNYIIIIFLHFSLWDLFSFIPQLVICRLAVSIYERSFLSTLKGFISSFLLFIPLLKCRSVLSGRVRMLYNYGNYMGRCMKQWKYSES